MNTDLDALLEESLLEVPGDFAAHMVRRLAHESALRRPPVPPAASRWRRLMQWLALGSSLAVGAAQLAGFMFGLWTATAVG